jgi:hypothetical protein
VALGMDKFRVVRKFDPGFGAYSTQRIRQWNIGKSKGDFFVEESLLLGDSCTAL